VVIVMPIKEWRQTANGKRQTASESNHDVLRSTFDVISWEPFSDCGESWMRATIS